MKTLLRLRIVAPLALLAACGGSDAPADDAAPDASMEAPAENPFTVTITQPAEGAEVEGSDVTVRMTVTGVRINPAGEVVEGTGHHHLYLDADLTPAGTPVPTVPGEIIHMGDGSAEYTFEGVEPGEHRLIAVVADGIHIPLQPWVVDTVHFTVR